MDAFFAAVEYPVFAAAAMSRKILSDSVESHRAYEEIQSLTRRYNDLQGGKWRGLMDAAPRRLPVFRDVHARLVGEPADTLIACHACDYTEASEGCQTIQMLGHSMRAVAIPKGGELTYCFEVTQEGPATLFTAMIPTQPYDQGDLRYTVQLDDAAPVIISLREPFRSESWKQSVLRGQALKAVPVTLSKGGHTLRLKALDGHIIADQWMIR